LFFVH